MPKNNFLARWTIVIALVFVTSHTPQGQTPAPQLGKNSVKEVVAAMTTEEKVKLLVGMGLNLNIPGLPTPAAEDKIPEKSCRRRGTHSPNTATRYSLSNVV